MKLPGHGTGLALVAAASYQSDEIRVQTCSSCSASLSALGIVLIVVLVAVVSTSISVVLIYTSLAINTAQYLIKCLPTTCISSFVKYPFKSSAYLQNWTVLSFKNLFRGS